MASRRALDFYNDPKCNQLNGTDGTTMGSFISKDDTIYLFNGDACKWARHSYFPIIASL